MNRLLQDFDVLQFPAKVYFTSWRSPEPLRLALTDDFRYPDDAANRGVIQLLQVGQLMPTREACIGSWFGCRVDREPATESALPGSVLNVFTFVQYGVNPWLLDGECFHHSSISRLATNKPDRPAPTGMTWSGKIRKCVSVHARDRHPHWRATFPSDGGQRKFGVSPHH